VHGTKGVYELVYFIKESKSLERFKKHALESDKCIQGKTPEEVERLVCLILDSNHRYLISIVVVLENSEAQCSHLRSRHPLQPF
jgi:hypothetical protein